MDDPIWNKISKEAKQLIKLMLEKNYKTRHYARDILENPWFKNALFAARLQGKRKVFLE